MGWLSELFKGIGKTAQVAAPFVGMANPALGAGLAIGGGAATGGAKGALSSIPGAAMNYFMPGGNFGSAVKGGAPPVTTSAWNPMSVMNFLPTGSGNAGGGGGFMKPPTPPSGGPGGGGIFDMFKGLLDGDNAKNILGIGSLATGLMKQFPKVPSVPPSVEEARNSIRGGGSPLGQFAGGKLQEMMGQEYDALSQPEIDAALRQLERDQVLAEDQVRDTYRSIRPGTDPSSDNTFRRDIQEVQNNFAKAKADTVANRTRDTKAAFDQQRLAQIQTSLGASSQDMQQLTSLAQLDIAQIMAQLNLDAEQARLFKTTFLDLAGSLLSPPSPLDQFLSEQMKATARQ